MPESGSVVLAGFADAAESGVAGLSVSCSEAAGPGVAASTVSSAAAEVTAGDFIGLGRVTADSFDPSAAGLAAAASAGVGSAGVGSAGFDPAGEGDFGLVVREAASRSGVAGGGVAPVDGDLPEADESERDFSPADFEGEPRASATVKSDDLSLPSGESPFLLFDSGLGSTLFRTTVSG